MILAGISISILSGKNGILTRAKESKIKSRAGAVQEQIDLWKSEKNIDSMAYDYPGGTEEGHTARSLDDVLTLLVNRGYLKEDEKRELETKGSVTIDNKTITVYEENIENENNGNSNDNEENSGEDDTTEVEVAETTEKIYSGRMLSPDGQYLYQVESNDIKILNLDTGTVERKLDGTNGTCSKNGNVAVAKCGGKSYVFDKSCNLLYIYDGLIGNYYAATPSLNYLYVIKGKGTTNEGSFRVNLSNGSTENFSMPDVTDLTQFWGYEFLTFENETQMIAITTGCNRLYIPADTIHNYKWDEEEKKFIKQSDGITLSRTGMWTQTDDTYGTIQAIDETKGIFSVNWDTEYPTRERDYTALNSFEIASDSVKLSKISLANDKNPSTNKIAGYDKCQQVYLTPDKKYMVALLSYYNGGSPTYHLVCIRTLNFSIVKDIDISADYDASILVSGNRVYIPKNGKMWKFTYKNN